MCLFPRLSVDLTKPPTVGIALILATSQIFRAPSPSLLIWSLVEFLSRTCLVCCSQGGAHQLTGDGLERMKKD